MYFEPDNTYHIYNRSNEQAFFNRENYFYFLKKINILIRPNADILSWCLMPNHFHILLVTNESSCSLIEELHRPNVQLLSKNIGTLLSSYTRAINKQENRKGRLFSHNTQAKCLNDKIDNEGFLSNCLHYIHQNPLRAGLCNCISDYEFSSYLDYCGNRRGKLVNKELAYEMLGVSADEFKQHSEVLINEAKVKEML